MGSKLIRYGKFYKNKKECHCVACIEYEDIVKRNEKCEFVKVGEKVYGVYNVRGTLDYIEKYGVTKCLRWSSLQALIDEEIQCYGKYGFAAYEPVEI